MPAGNEAGPQRLFLALWPDSAVRVALLEARAWVGPAMAGQWMKPDNLHLTLAFLGEVGPERWPEIDRVAEVVAAGPGFSLVFDRAEFWRRNGIVCLAASQTPGPLQDLAEGLARGLGAAGFPMESRPYRAHLTLARKGRSERDALVLPQPVAWRADAFCLVESRLSPSGAAYFPRRAWPLRGT
jgi:2'-5' RNA ligase